MRKIIFIAIALMVSITTIAQDKKAYKLFDAKGKEVTYKEMITSLIANDVVMIGEIHNCPITHWLENEIIKDLYAKHGGKLTIGAEMFEADNQLIIDEYMDRLITGDRFEAEARLWSNYTTDYSNIVSIARDNKLKFVATNVPRRYANMVKNGGFEVLDNLSEEAKRYIAPLPIEYTPDENSDAMFELMMMTSSKKSDPQNIAKAQALKDATMGWFIAQNIKPNGKFVHLNGNFHSDFKGGIIPYLNRYKPGLKTASVCAVRQDEINKLDEENEGRADFYICVPIDMTMTY